MSISSGEGLLPKYKIPILGSDISVDMLRIKLHIYDVFTICSKHDTLGPGNSKYDVCSCSNYEHDNVKPVTSNRKKIDTKRVSNRKFYDRILLTRSGKEFTSHQLCSYNF